MDFLIIFVLILCNAMFAMAELSLVSSRKGRLEELANKGSRSAQIAVQLTENMDDLFSTVQMGITLISILAGVYSGATFADQLTVVIAQIPLLHAVAAPLSYVIVVTIITFVSIVFGELIPKKLAMSNPEFWSIRLSPILFALSKFLKPFIKVLNLSSHTVLRATGALSNSQPSITADEIMMVVEEGREAGVVAAEEQTIVERALTLDDRPVSSLMTPRREVFWLALADDSSEHVRQIARSKHTWYPVCEEAIDNVKGVFCVKDLFTEQGTVVHVKDVIRPAFFVPANTSALKLIEQFRKDNMHIAFVVDEHGSFEGLITLHDISSSILGLLPERNSEEPKPIVERADGSFLIEASLPIQEFEAKFDLNLAEENDAHEFQTLAGFILQKLGRIPETGAVFDFSSFRFEIVDMDGNRIDKLLVSKVG